MDATNLDYNRRQKKKRLSRSPAEYGKCRKKRKKHQHDESQSKTFLNNTHSQHSFFNNLLLLRQNTRKQNAINTNALIDPLNATIDEQNHLKRSTEDVSCSVFLFKYLTS